VVQHRRQRSRTGYAALGRSEGRYVEGDIIRFQVIYQRRTKGMGGLEDSQEGKRRYGRCALDEGFEVLLDLLLINCRSEQQLQMTDDLRKYPLQKDFHDSIWIGEDGLDDLSFLADGDSDLFEQGFHAGLRVRRCSVRISDCLPSVVNQSEAYAKAPGCSHMSTLA